MMKSTAAELEKWDRSTVFHPSIDLNAHAKGLMDTPRIMETASGINVVDCS